MICDDLISMICSYGYWEDEHLDPLNEKIVKKAAYIAFSRAFSYEESRYILQETPSLVTAARRGYNNIVKLVLSTEKFDRDLYIEALNEAIEKGHLSIIKLILSASMSDSDIEAVVNDCFCSACSVGNIDIVRYFISIGAYCHTHRDTPIKLASRRGHYDVVQLLLESDVYSCDVLSYVSLARGGDNY